MFPQYNHGTLQHELTEEQPGSVSPSAFKEEDPARGHEIRPYAASGTMSMHVDSSLELHDKQPGQNDLPSREAPTGLESQQTGFLHDSIALLDVPIGGKNVGAAKRGGPVRWFDEEVQLLTKLQDQGKSWEETYEVRSPDLLLLKLCAV